MEDFIIGTDFSGLGSLEEALKLLQVKYRSAFACDKDKYVKASYLANHQTDIFYDDITTRDNENTSYCDGYVFGFPCQAFSIAGNRKGFEDTRGSLVYNSANYIKLKRPRFFVAENVRGLLSHDNGRTFGVIRDLFGKTINGQQNLYKYDDCLDYHVYYKILNAKDYCIPQNRERIFIIGFRDEEDAKRFNFPKKIKLEYSVEDFLQPEEVIDEKYYLSETALRRLIKKEYSNPQINPQITGTLNTKNNSGQLSFDSGTTLIVTNNHGQLIQQEIFNCIDANYQKGMDNHGQRSLILINKNDKTGFEIAEAYDTINYSAPHSTTRRGRVGKKIANSFDTDGKQAVLIPMFGTAENSDAERIYSAKGIARTMKSGGGGGGANTGLYLVDGFKVRRLTPLEVFRLFGYSDAFFEKCASINSDTQLYKQAGNSISVLVLVHLLIQILKALNIPYTYE